MAKAGYSALADRLGAAACDASAAPVGYVEEDRMSTASLHERGRAVRDCEWDSPAYEVLHRAGLMRSDWRVRNAAGIRLRGGNTTPGANCVRSCAAWACFPFCGPCVKAACCRTAEIPAGSVQRMEDGRGGFEFLGQGVHFYCDMFMRLAGPHQSLSSVDPRNPVVIVNGDCTIVEVGQGFVGLAMDMGQPILLPPGLHQWQSPTMAFKELIDLHQPCIAMGPYTLLTVDKGYDAITQNNGRQQVLEGGSVHLLNHRNWKFEKFITRKIQTDDLQRIEAITGDNVLMKVDATVCWHIRDSQLCAERGAETMHQGQMGDIRKLRNDVLKQAEASLSAFVGKVNFSDTFSTAAAVATGVRPDAVSVSGIVVPQMQGVQCDAAPLPPTPPSSSHGADMNMLFDLDKLRDAVTHANDMTMKYGVEVLSINIISARPADAQLMTALAKGAVAAAEAQQFETTARGRARAAKIEAQGCADALTITARADADAEVTRAAGSLEAAQRLRQEGVAVTLATIHAQGDALKQAKSNLILGNDAKGLGSLLLANPNVIPHP